MKRRVLKKQTHRYERQARIFGRQCRGCHWRCFELGRVAARFAYTRTAPWTAEEEAELQRISAFKQAFVEFMREHGIEGY